MVVRLPYDSLGARSICLTDLLPNVVDSTRLQLNIQRYSRICHSRVFSLCELLLICSQSRCTSHPGRIQLWSAFLSHWSADFDGSPSAGVQRCSCSDVWQLPGTASVRNSYRRSQQSAIILATSSDVEQWSHGKFFAPRSMYCSLARTLTWALWRG
jgi:hypothetical protein